MAGMSPAPGRSKEGSIPLTAAAHGVGKHP